MSVITLRPSSTVDNDGVTYNGASAHATVNDNSDSTYLSAFGLGDSVRFALDDITVPAGAVVKSITARLRCASGSTSQNDLSVYLTYGFAIVTKPLTINWQSITTVTVPLVADASAISDALIDGANFGIESPTSHAAQALIHEVYVDVTCVAQPVTVPSLPTGTITDTNIPAVQWANTLDSDGGAQTHFQVRVFTAAQYGAGGFNAASSTATFDTGDTSSAAVSTQVTTPLADGNYRAYVRVGQTVNGATHWSDYAYTAFTIDVDLPAVPDAPTLTVQTGRIKVHVEGNAGTATTTHLEVQRSEDAGATYEPLRLTTDTDGLITGTSSDEYDYEAPNGTLMTYRVRALHEISAGNYVASAWASATATWSDTAWWLKCPEQPALNMVVVPASLPGYQRPGRQGVFQPLGSTETVIVADKRGAPRGTLRLQIDTPAEQDDLDALLDSNLTLLLQGPPAHHWTDRYVRFGDQDRQRWIDKAWIGEHLDTLQWWQVARPVGVVDSWPA